MTMMTTDVTVGELVAERPGRSRVFEQLGIDYCCGGKKPLAEVCGAKGLDPQTVVKMLLAIEQAGEPREPDCQAMSLTELADHIEATHHAYLREELPRLSRLVGRIAEVHGQRRPELVELSAVFGDFVAEIESHMLKEEDVLFPMIRQIDGASSPPSFHCGSLANPIRVMELEHDGAGNALARMRELTNGFVPPEDACNTYRAAFDALAGLEANMHQHVHKENNILFPRALEVEARLHGTGG